MRNDPAQVRLSAEQYLNGRWCAIPVGGGMTALAACYQLGRGGIGIEPCEDCCQSTAAWLGKVAAQSRIVGVRDE